MKKYILIISLLTGSLGMAQQLVALMNGSSNFEELGTSVSLSDDGKFVAAGAYKHNGSTGQVVIYENVSGHPWVSRATINGVANGDNFGEAVSLSGDGTTVVIGAPRYDVTGSNPANEIGLVRIYKKAANGTWSQLGGDIVGEANADLSGSAVSINKDGTIVAIGAPENGTDRQGHVRVYQYQSATSSWVQLGSDIDGTENGAVLGTSVSLNATGSILAIGASGTTNRTGSVKVYEYNSSTSSWSQKGSTLIGEAELDHFGISVSLNDTGSILAIGSYDNAHPNPSNPSGPTIRTGDVRIFEYSSNTWSQIGSDIEGDNAGDHFGFSVSLSNSGDVLVIGAPDAIINGKPDTGLVKKYKNINSTWVQLGVDIKMSSGTAGNVDRLGKSVCTDGDGIMVAVGVPGVSTLKGRVNIYNSVNQELLPAIGIDADGGPDRNPTAAELNSLPNVSGAIQANEGAYQDYINNNPNAFGSPATEAQVQAMINTVNAQQAQQQAQQLLAAIGADENDGTTNSINVTAAQLNALPNVSGAVAANEGAYQDYIDANNNNFDEPATEAQVQVMVTTVNAQQALLADIGTDADGGADTNPTATELNNLPNVSGAVATNEGAYQDYINNNPNAFSSPATEAEIQTMINTVNTQQAQQLLAAIGADENDGTASSINVTAAQLNALPNVSGAVAANEGAYQDYIDANNNNFDEPATEAQVQTMIDTVNLLVAIGEDADGTGPDTAPTATELNNLPNVSGAIQGNEGAYQDYINNNPDAFSSPATEAEIQTMINTVNATLSVNDNEFIKTLNVYPNPTSDYVKISFGKTLTNVHVKVFNLVGQQVSVMVNNSQSNTVTLNVSNLAKGNYLIMIISDQGSAIKQLFIK